jgi:hypothetical protein
MPVGICADWRHMTCSMACGHLEVYCRGSGKNKQV